MIIVFNSTILRGDYYFVEEFFNFERRINNSQIQPSHRETERFQRQLTTNQTNLTRTGHFYNKGSTCRSTVPLHALVVIFLYLQFMSDCHLLAFLLLS